MDKSKIEHLDKKEYTHLPHAEQEFENHEQTDVAIRPLVWTLVVLVVVVGVTYAGMAGVFQLFDYMAEKSSDNPKLTNVESAAVRTVPADKPALQGVPALEANPNSPAQDMVLFRDKTKEVMAGRAPMRPGFKNGMPIDQAIDEAMSRKIFKTRAAAETQPTTGPTSAPNESAGAGAGLTGDSSGKQK